MYSNSCSTFVMLLTLNWGTILLDLYDLDNKTERSFDLKGCVKHENNSYFTSQQLQAAYQAARLKKMFFMMSWYPVMIKLLQSIFKFRVKTFLYYLYELISKKGNSLEILFSYDNFLFPLENLTRYDVDSFSVETTTYWPFKNNLVFFKSCLL